MMSPEPTAMPATRSSRQKATSRLVNESGTGRDRGEVVLDQFEVVALFHHRAEGVGRGSRVKVGLAKEAERPGPVDRLGHARRLGQVKLAQPVDRGDDFPGELLGNARLTNQHDLYLTFWRRVADPVIQAAPFQRVVQ